MKNNLTEHFTLEELTHTSTGIYNVPDEDHIKNLEVLAQGLELVRSAIGNKPIKINSGYRSKDLNMACGGTKNSAHLLGYAADIVSGTMTNKDICSAIIKAGIKFDQLIDESSKGGQWVHISFAPELCQHFLVFSNGKYENGLTQ